MKNCKSRAEIAELTKNPDFALSAAAYLDTYVLMNSLREEMRTITQIPKTTQLIVDRLLEYHRELVRAEVELESKGLSKSDVFAWQYDNAESQQ